MYRSRSTVRRWIRFATCAALAVASIGALGPARAQAPERIEIRPVSITYRVTLPPPAEDGIDRLGGSARVVPVIEGGVTTGFRVSAVRAGQIWDRAGWRVGDILGRVYGEVFDSRVRGLEMEEGLMTADRVQVSI